MKLFAVHLLLEAKQCLVKQQRELVLYERMKYIVRAILLFEPEYVFSRHCQCRMESTYVPHCQSTCLNFLQMAGYLELR